MTTRAARPRRRQTGSFRPLRHAEQLTKADRVVLGLLQQMPLRVWSRKALSEAAQLPDRTTRECVSRISSVGGIAVLSSSSGAGYWIAATADEVDQARAELISRMRVISDRASALEQTAKLMRDREASGATGPLARPQALL